MLTKKDIFNILQENKPKIKNFGVKRIGLFGSFVRSEQRKKSDIDILVEFEEAKKTFDNYMSLKFFLQRRLGHKVDVVIKNTLKRRIKSYVMKEVEYA